MNETQWASATNPEPMLTFLHRTLPSVELKRKLRLLICGWCRRAWYRLTDRRQRLGAGVCLEVAERYAEGAAQEDELILTREGLRASWGEESPWGRIPLRVVQALRWLEDALAVFLGRPIAARGTKDRQLQAAVLHDLFGNPFRPVTVEPAWLTWNGAAVMQMARTIYEERRFEDLPFLADALEEAGCTDPTILGHCRGPGPHVLGCWVVDLLLGKG
ncbi:MAG: hypothetical protein L0Z62_32730 [Gemmataceae bacterium]|nr:hypothetical protein [Gemmataceae bacterium]